MQAEFVVDDIKDSELDRPLTWDWCKLHCDEIISTETLGHAMDEHLREEDEKLPGPPVCSWFLPGDDYVDVRLVVHDDLSAGLYSRDGREKEWEGVAITWQFTTVRQLVDMLRVLKACRPVYDVAAAVD